MPYVPPHLRNGGVTAARPPSPPSRGGGGGGRDSGRGFGGRDERDSRGFDRRDDRDRRDLPESRPSPPIIKGPGPRNLEPVWADWKPTARVLAFTQQQVDETRQRLNITLQQADPSKPVPAPIELFEEMNLHADLMDDIRFHAYEKPTPIQCQGIPIALSGRDILGCAETGSGKTASFALPMIQHCKLQPSLKRGDGPLALVLAPTRELAQQIEKEVKAFSRSSKGFRTAIVVGGTNMSEQRNELQRGVEIVVATPGRFIDHLHQNTTGMERISFLVLDEADRMLDMGFEPQIREILRGISGKQKVQTLLFSATMPEEIERLAQEFLKDPVRIKVGQVSSPTANVEQNLEPVPEPGKLDRLLHLVVDEFDSAKRAGVEPPLTIVFVERKTLCDDVARALVEQGLAACALHGGRSQQEREASLADFRTGRAPVLVATDVASRGLDVSGVAHVINFDLPKTLEDYVHRIGRTGRAGSTGRATSFYTDRDTYIVAQIKTALNEVAKGNTLAFVTGKAARQKQREEAAAAKEAAANPKANPVQINGQYKFMQLAFQSDTKSGLADSAWDD
eukprot:jgi/Mesvir1/15459/Mv11439-RA.1